VTYIKPEVTELGPAPIVIQGTKIQDSDFPGRLAVPADCEFED
jgi:hypothetical protein